MVELAEGDGEEDSAARSGWQIESVHLVQQHLGRFQGRLNLADEEAEDALMRSVLA